MDKLEEGVAGLLYVKIEDDILRDNSTVEYQIIEHQQTLDDWSVPEHQSDTSTGISHRVNSGKIVNIL